MSTPYEEIAETISKWCETHSYSDFIVTIDLNGTLITEVLEFDGGRVDFIWLSDWWEGEKNVSLVGFRPIGDIKVEGPPAENSQSPAEDVRPVVLCRDCRRWEVDWVPTHAKENEHFCPIVALTTRNDWFCADGEKREEVE